MCSTNQLCVSPAITTLEITSLPSLLSSWSVFTPPPTMSLLYFKILSIVVLYYFGLHFYSVTMISLWQLFTTNFLSFLIMLYFVFSLQQPTAVTICFNNFSTSLVFFKLSSCYLCDLATITSGIHLYWTRINVCIYNTIPTMSLALCLQSFSLHHVCEHPFFLLPLPLSFYFLLHPCLSIY